MYNYSIPKKTVVTIRANDFKVQISIEIFWCVNIYNIFPGGGQRPFGESLKIHLIQ